MKAQVRIVAAERAEKVGAARAEYDVAEGKARAQRNEKVGAATREFEDRRASIIDSFEAQAAERVLAAKLDKEEAAA